MLDQSTSQDPSILSDILHTSSLSNNQPQEIELETVQIVKTSRLKEVPDKLIEVLSDEEEKDIIKSQLEEELFRTKIEEAKLTKSKTNILKVLYIELHFKNISDQLKDKKFNGMIKAYIAKNLKTSKKEPFDMRNSYFFDRMMPKPDDEFVENEYILYGCDLLSQRAIEKMFQFYSPSIKWIDSSHCKLTFLQKLKGWEAVVNNCRDLGQLLKDQTSYMKVENLMNDLQLDQQEEMQIQFDNQYNEEYAKLQKSKKDYHLLKYYVDLMPYYELGFRRRLMIRNVTVTEQKIGYNLNGENKSEHSFRQDPTQDKKPDSDFKKYQALKEKLWSEIQNDPLVKPMYEKIEKEMQREQDLLLAYKPRPKKYDKQNHRPNSNYRSYGQSSNGDRSQFDARSQHFYEDNAYSNPRTRSRDPTERYNRTEIGGYQGRNFQKNFDRRSYNKFESIQKQFDTYIEQRQGFRILQNPAQYLEPEFIDEATGTHFYRNPFYNPDVFANNEPNRYPNSRYQRNNYQRNNFYPFPYPSQSQHHDNTVTGYEYEGNRQPNRGIYGNNYNQRGGNSQYSGSSRTGKNPFYQGQSGSEKNQSSLKSSLKNSQVEEEFNRYVAERQAAKNRPSTPQTIPLNKNANEYFRSRKGPEFKNNQSTDNVFGQDPDFSIISEEKSMQQSNQRKELIREENLENILNEIHDDETPIVQPIDHMQGQIDDSESEGLEFMLQQRDALIKREVKMESFNRYQSNMSNNPGYIVETIKAEHVPRWMKSNNDVDNYQEDLSSKSIPNPQFTVEFDQESEYNQQMARENVMNGSMKKKAPRKKERSSSKSSRKRSDSSQGQLD